MQHIDKVVVVARSYHHIFAIDAVANGAVFGQECQFDIQAELH